MDTNEIQKTITMPAPLLAGWLAALRSGEYGQTQGALETWTDQGQGYCCLGVLQMVASGKTEAHAGHGVPSEEWRVEHSVTFTSPSGHSNAGSPYLEPLGCTADAANDSMDVGGVSHAYDFLAIADAIEACAVGL